MRALIVAGVAGLCVVAGVANAAVKPSLTLTLPASANAGQPISFSWAAKHVPAKDHVVLQRPEGTARVWTTIETLKPSAAGTATIPALGLGAYRLRLAAVPRRGKPRHGRLLGSKVMSLDVYGDVPLSVLFPNGDYNAVIGGNGDTGAGTATTSTNTFSYVLGGVTGSNPFVTVSNNDCRSAHLAFLPSDPNPPQSLLSATATVTVVQESRDPTSATAQFDALSSLDVTLVPRQTWSINITASPDASRGFYVYFNGSASCFSTQPFTARAS